MTPARCNCIAPRVRPETTNALTCLGCGNLIPTTVDVAKLRAACALERIADRLENMGKPATHWYAGPR